MYLRPSNRSIGEPNRRYSFLTMRPWNWPKTHFWPGS